MDGQVHTIAEVVRRWVVDEADRLETCPTNNRTDGKRLGFAKMDGKVNRWGSRFLVFSEETGGRAGRAVLPAKTEARGLLLLAPPAVG